MKPNLFKIALFIVIILLLVLSCEDEKNECKGCPCGVENPVEELEWLKSMIDDKYAAEVYYYNYNGQGYFSIINLPDSINYIKHYFTCEGDLFFFTFKPHSFNDYPEGWESAIKTLIYTKEDTSGNCACGVENPIENINWLNEYLNYIIWYKEIYLLRIDGQEYISAKDHYEANDGAEYFFDCNGNLICYDGGLDGGGCPSEFNWTTAGRKLIYVYYEDLPNKY